MATVCFPQNACNTSISDTNFLPTEKGTTYPGKYAGVFHEVATGTAPYLYLDEHNPIQPTVSHEITLTDSHITQVWGIKKTALQVLQWTPLHFKS